MDGQRFVEWQHHFSVLVLEIAGNKSEFSIGGVATFLCLLLRLKVFGDNDSKISLLFRENVHHCSFVNIKFHLPLVGLILSNYNTSRSK